MLSDAQLQFFEDNGYLVIENVLDQNSVISPIRNEYSELLDRLCETWADQGLLERFPATTSFESKLLSAYVAGCDWFQPMDISLPGDRICADTPMHFGPAIFDLMTNEHLLDVVASIIGDEITSNPIQHVRIKPPATKLTDNEVRAHITATDWHQDRGVTHADADGTQMARRWLQCGVRSLMQHLKMGVSRLCQVAISPGFCHTVQRSKPRSPMGLLTKKMQCRCRLKVAA